MHRTLCDFLADLYQNAIEAEARKIEVILDQGERFFHWKIADDGKGMDEEELARAQDAFYTDGIKHPHRRVGLGLPLVIQTLEMTGGRFQIHSSKGEGTVVETTFDLQHWDTPPLGDLPVCLGQMMAWKGDYEAVVVRRFGSPGFRKEYRISRSELRDAVGDFEDLSAMALLRDFFRSGESELKQTEERT